MLKSTKEELLGILEKEVVPATGCTEPVAIAYSTAVARHNLDGEVLSVEILVDPYLFKNAMCVGIPGIKERGLDIAAALGLIIGDPEKQLRILEDITPEYLQKAKELIAQKKVSVHIEKQCTSLYIETILVTNQGKIRVITVDNHLNVVKIEKEAQEGEPYNSEGMSNPQHSKKEIQKYNIEEILQAVNDIPIEKISFLQGGFDMNLAIAQEGLSFSNSIGNNIVQIMKKELGSNDMINRAQSLCAGASEARMRGSRMSVMSVAGSGNHGITVFLILAAVAQVSEADKEKSLRAVALSILLTAYIKSYTGTLSAMCGCGVAAGIGASAGVVYLMGGGVNETIGAMRNMVGSISGLICDGAKEGCAYKLALAAGWAVQAAMLALNGSIINQSDGIVTEEFAKMIKNLGYVCSPGMIETNNAIVEIMIQK